MKNQTAIVIAVVVVVAVGLWYWQMQSAAPAPTPTTVQPGASGAAGINGSANQGNLGQPSTGVPQQPGGSAEDDQGIGDMSTPQ